MNTFIPDIASISDLQRKYAALIKQVKKSGQPLLVLKKNKPEAVLMSTHAYENFMEKVDAYEQQSAIEAISAYEKEKKAGTLRKLNKANELFE